MRLVKAWVEEIDGRRIDLESIEKEGMFKSYIRPERDLKPRTAFAVFKEELGDSKVLVNGFQSWTESFIADGNSRIKKLNLLASNIFKLRAYGDYHFNKTKDRKGFVFSHEYLQIFEGEKERLFAGNMTPEKHYGIFDVDFNEGLICYRTDLEGLEMEAGKEYETASVFIGRDSEEYFRKRKLDCSDLKKLTGWTSWYNYYTGISEKIITENLEALSSEQIPIDVFQIDDGYQEAVGDWLRINGKFPNGMKIIADKAREKGYTPGLWLAPFACEKKSELYKSHPEMVIRTDAGRKIPAGYNYNWSYFFYGLNIYNQDFRSYIAEVFDTVVNSWGYGFVKLDFLYAAALRPYPGKTRAMVMNDALELINNIRGSALMLGCGCPLGVAAGMCEYMRIGADVAPMWEDAMLKRISYRERVSTACSLSSTKSRYFLNGKAFMNDPDVFILRTSDEIKMTEEQKMELFNENLNKSGLVFFSDDIRTYDDKTLQLVKKRLSEFSLC